MIHKIPFALALLTMIGGVFIAILFGANEDLFKKKIEAQLANNVHYSSIQDPAEQKKQMAAEADKNWRYYQRFHFHATGIGAMSLAVLTFLAVLTTPTALRSIASWAVAVGGFLYPFVWLFAAMWGPEIGRGPAKEKFAVFGYMGGVFLLGLLLALVQYFRSPAKES
jgi:hypothetical protein